MAGRFRQIFIPVLLSLSLLLAMGCIPIVGYASGDYASTAAPDTVPEQTAPCAEAAVMLGEKAYAPDTASLSICDPDADELFQKLSGFSGLNTVTLTGDLPAADRLLALKQAYPDIRFVWDFDFCGVPVNTLTESVDLSGIRMADTQALEALLPCFYRLETVDMSGCGISNEEMDALNRRWPDTRFIWEVIVGGFRIRTDVQYFMAYQLRYPYYTYLDYSDLRYCTEITTMDFGHYKVKDLSFVENMPNLQYLLLGDTLVQDLTPIGTCTRLRYLELFYNPICDFWSLTNLSELEDLNLGYTPRYQIESPDDPWNYQPLLQMTWLDRLWLPGTGLSTEEQALLQAALPDTLILFQSSSGSTNQGWRYSPNSYRQRDAMGMDYLHG